jgi:hypothetical protein
VCECTVWVSIYQVKDVEVEEAQEEEEGTKKKKKKKSDDR